MKAHVEIHIRLDLAGGKTLHDVLREFARKTKGWKFRAKPSEDYQERHRSPAGFADCDSVVGLERAGVALANVNPKHQNSFRVTEIVPMNPSSLTVEQYNEIGIAFAVSFRRFLRASKYGGAVEIEGPEIGLKEIIRGEKCRRFFEAYLHTPTPTGHPSDINVLDRFICALFRYNTYVDLDKLRRHLVEDRKWRDEAAVFVARRIQIGLDILAENRRF